MRINRLCVANHFLISASYFLDCDAPDRNHENEPGENQELNCRYEYSSHYFFFPFLGAGTCAAGVPPTEMRPLRES